MITFLDNLDKSILKWINTAQTIDFIELVLIWLRHPLIWVPVYVFFISFIIFNYRNRWYRILLYLFVAVGVTDLISARLLKPFIGRLRPCHQNLDFDLIERVHCGGLYSFTSNHAANHFAISTFLYLVLRHYFPNSKYPLFIWAATVSLCQVYVGKHFPGDIVFGALLGISISLLSYTIYNRFVNT